MTNYYREGRILKKDDGIEIDVYTVDGIGLPPYARKVSGGYPKRINDIINMDTRPDDIILATFPKSGTHWMCEILDMLTRGSAEYSKENLLNPIDLLTDLDQLNGQQSLRVLHTHMPYKWFPRRHKENEGKIIHCTRNPKDTYVSLFHHFSLSLEHGEKTKGMTWAQFFDNCVIGKACVYGTWFDYEKEMRQARKNNRNIYTVHYERLKEDLDLEIQAISNFLNLQISDELIKEIARKCSFKNLKKVYEEIKEYPLPNQKMITELKEMIPDFQHPNIFRKGIVGDWKNHFTVEQSEQFDDLYQREMMGTETD